MTRKLYGNLVKRNERRKKVNLKKKKILILIGETHGCFLPKEPKKKKKKKIVDSR